MDGDANSRLVTSMGAAVLVAALTCATGIGAQSVRGSVLQPDSATHAPGVVVVAADGRGDVVARTLSTETGEFDLRVPGAGHQLMLLPGVVDQVKEWLEHTPRAG